MNDDTDMVFAKSHEDEFSVMLKQIIESLLKLFMMQNIFFHCFESVRNKHRYYKRAGISQNAYLIIYTSLLFPRLNSQFNSYVKKIVYRQGLAPKFYHTYHTGAFVAVIRNHHLFSPTKNDIQTFCSLIDSSSPHVY